MRHVCIYLLLCSALSAAAQEALPKAEVFGGYSYLHIDTERITGSTLDTGCNNIFGPGTCPPGSFGVHPSANGWNASAQYNATRFFGIKADFSGHYNTPVTISSQIANSLAQLGVTGLPPKAHSYSYLFGPVVFQSKGRYEPFAHALFGQNSIGTNLSNVKVNGIGIPGLTVSDTAFAMAFGGGVDIRINERVAMRAGEVDYLYTKHDFSAGNPSVASHQNNLRASVGIVFQLGGTHQTKEPQPRAENQHVTGTMPIPALGVYVVQADNGGAKVRELIPNGAAALAGLRSGDIINTVNGSPVRSPAELSTALSAFSPGSSVHLGYAIHGAWQAEATVTLGHP